MDKMDRLLERGEDSFRTAGASGPTMAHSSAELADDVGREKENTAPRNQEAVEDKEDEEEEFVLLDLDEVFNGAALPTNCAYTLSGLDTMNPVLTLKDDLKLALYQFHVLLASHCRCLGDEYMRAICGWQIGEYEETIGTVLVFSERDEQVPEDERIRGSNIEESGTRKRISSVYRTERRLKFRIMEKDEYKETVL